MSVATRCHVAGVADVADVAGNELTPTATSNEWDYSNLNASIGSSRLARSAG
jgi:hypothetical protein